MGPLIRLMRADLQNYSPLLPAYALVRDAYNRARFGVDAPRFAEPILVKTAMVATFWDHAKAGMVGYHNSAQVRTGIATRPLSESTVLRTLVEHWKHGTPWEVTGEIQRLSPEDGMSDFLAPDGVIDPSVYSYLARVDSMFARASVEGRLLRRDELGEKTFRAHGSVLIHIDSNGMPIFGGGNHRLAAAIAANIEFLPAQIGIVHPAAIPLLHSFRKPDRRSD